MHLNQPCFLLFLIWLSPEELRKEMTRLEDAMSEAAANLEFEEAARLRDRLHGLRERQLALGAV